MITEASLQLLQAALAAGGKRDIADLKVKEVVVLRKFGGDEPRACRDEDCVEEIEVVRENGEVVSRTNRQRLPDGSWSAMSEGVEGKGAEPCH